MYYQYKEKIEYRWYRVRYYCSAEGGEVDKGWKAFKTIPYRYRFDPVPGVHCNKSRRFYFRRIRTTQERRWAYAHEGYFRRRRNSKNLPNSWDDFYASKNRNRGWKRTKKKHQWE